MYNFFFQLRQLFVFSKSAEQVCFLHPCKKKYNMEPISLFLFTTSLPLIELNTCLLVSLLDKEKVKKTPKACLPLYF